MTDTNVTTMTAKPDHPAADAKEIVRGLKNTLERLWAIDGMIQVLKASEGEELPDQSLRSYGEAMSLILAPSYEAIEEALKALTGQVDS